MCIRDSFKHCGESGVGANSVVVTVAADHRAVETRIACLSERHGAKLRGEQIGFVDSVLLIEYAENIKLYSV